MLSANEKRMSMASKHTPKGSADFNALLYNKVQEEFAAFLDRLTTMPGKEIIEHSYEKVIKEDMVSCLTDMHLEQEKAKALYLMPYPLDYLYREWLKNDFSFNDMLRETIFDGADRALDY